MSMSAALRSARRPPFLQVAKSAAATIAAWLLAGWLVPGQPPVFAAIAALLVVQPSINQSLTKGLERTVGVVVGVVVASALSVLFGNATWVVMLAVVAALVLVWLLRMTPGTGNQVGISAMLVLALGDATAGYAVDRVVETLIGAAVGLIVNVVIVPPVSTVQAERAIADAEDSLTLNPRARGHRDRLVESRAILDRFGPIATQVIGMTRAFTDQYDASLADEPTMRAIADQLHRAAHDIRLATDRAAAADPGAIAEPPALTRPLTVTTPSADHWVLIGSLLVDLDRIHAAVVALATSSDADDAP